MKEKKMILQNYLKRNCADIVFCYKYNHSRFMRIVIDDVSTVKIIQHINVRQCIQSACLIVSWLELGMLFLFNLRWDSGSLQNEVPCGLKDNFAFFRKQTIMNPSIVREIENLDR